MSGNLVVILCILVLAPAESTSRPRPVPPEDRVLDPSRLREELLQRGMSELLKAYLADCPPTSEADKLIYDRELQLAIYADKSRDEDECLAALDKAIGLVEEAITRFPNDVRSLDWRLQLGKDILYKKAEPYYNNILFRGGTATDREQLLAIATRATQVFSDLDKVFTRWNQSLGKLKEADLRKLENSGEITRYRSLEVNAKYFNNWAKFYRALAMPAGKPREDLLKEIISYLTVEKREWIETDHKESGVQCQSLLLLGMAYRLSGNDGKAMETLQQAVRRTEALEPGDRRNLQWVASLGKMEQIKVLRDSGKQDEALKGIRELTRGLSEEPQSLSIELAAALLECSIIQAQAEAAKARKDDKAAAEFFARTRQPLIMLANRRPQAKSHIYQEIYPLFSKIDDLKALGPFDKAVCIGGLLGDAARSQQRMQTIRKTSGSRLTPAQQQEISRLDVERVGRYDKAIEVAESLLADTSPQAAELRPEALFNLGVCQYQRGKPLPAIETFTRLVREHPKHAGTMDAALYAVQIGSDAYRDPANRNQPSVRSAFWSALKTLIDAFPTSSEARYWQFFLANLLDLQGDYRQAAIEYAKVDPSHENYLDARYQRIVALLNLYETVAASQQADAKALREQGETLVREAAACADFLNKQVDQIKEDRHRQEILQNAGDALLIAARVSNDPPFTDYATTLKLLDKFEDRYGDSRDLIGRALRMRIVAMQGLNQLDQARKLIPDYVRRDPQNAGATLSALLTSMQQEAARARERNDAARMTRAAQEAVDLAQWLYQWAQENRKQLKREELFSIRVQYAQALLEAKRYPEAQVLFQQCYDEDAARSPEKEATHGPTLVGLAECHYRLGQQAAGQGQIDNARKELTTASQQFMTVWRKAERNTPIWWQALLRALEIPVQLRELTVTQLDEARKTRVLTPQEKNLLTDSLASLNRVDQTLQAERTAQPELGGKTQEFSRLQSRLVQLRRKIEQLSQ